MAILVFRFSCFLRWKKPDYYEDELRAQMEELLGDSVSFVFGFDKDKQWSNKDTIKMSRLIQRIAIEYEGKVNKLMDELEGILEIVRCRYEMMLSGLMHQLPWDTVKLLKDAQSRIDGGDQYWDVVYEHEIK